MKIDHDFKMRTDDNLFLSIFNSLNIDKRKADNCFKIIYGIKKFNELKKIIKEQNGLLGIFNVDLTDELIIYSLLITQAQNKRIK